MLHGRRRHVHAEGQAHRQRAVSGRGEPRLPGARRPVEPRVLPAARCATGERGDAGGVDRIVRDDEVLEPDEALDAERSRRRRLLAQAPPDGAGRDRRGARAGGRSVHHHAGRPDRGSGAGARRRRRGAHGDRRLSLVHRLGPRHDDQPRGADARHRPARRGRLHPAHVRALRARRPDPEHVSGGREGRALPHRRCDAVVLPRRRSRTCACTDDRLTLATAVSDAEEDRRRPTSAARSSASASIRTTACSRRARRAISSPGWTRRSTTGW